MEVEEVNSYQMLCIMVGELLAHAGLMRAAFYSAPETHELGERFDEKLDGIVEEIMREVQEIQQFGEAFDDDGEGPVIH